MFKKFLNKKYFKKAKYIVYIKLVIKIFIFGYAFLFSTKSNSQDANTLYFKSLAELKYQNTDKAIEYINHAIDQSKRNVDFYMYRASIFYSINDYSKSIADYRKADKIKPNTASLFLAKLYSLQNNPDSSLYFLKKYLSIQDKVSKSEITLDKDFDNIKNTEQWKKLWEKENYTPAENDYSEAIYLYNYDKSFEALDLVNQITDKYKSFNKAYFLKAKIMAEYNNYKEAAKTMEEAVKYAPNNYEYYNFKAQCYFNLKKWDKAIDDYQQSLKINPLQIDVFYYLALCFYEKKMYIDALENIDFFVSIFYKDNQAIFLQAKINYDAGNFLTTIKIMNQLIDKNPGKPEYYSLRGQALLNSNSYESAYTDLALSLDINPSFTGNYYYMGIANLMMDKKEEACADWKKAIDNKDYKANEYYNKHCREYDKKINNN